LLDYPRETLDQTYYIPSRSHDNAFVETEASCPSSSYFFLSYLPLFIYFYFVCKVIVRLCSDLSFQLLGLFIWAM